jgi:limonene-1,2-epoxide hydrolase
VAEPKATASPEDVVRRFCSAVSARDTEILRPMLGDNVVYHNIPLEPSQGIDATLEALATLFVMFDEITFEIVHLAATGNTVLTERVDLLRTARAEAMLPVMGSFDVKNGRIVAWRDYFDIAQAGSLLNDG